MKQTIIEALKKLQNDIKTPNIDDFPVGTCRCSHIFSANKTQILEQSDKQRLWIDLGTVDIDGESLNVFCSKDNFINVYFQNIALTSVVFNEDYKGEKMDRGVAIDAQAMIRDRGRNYLDYLIESDGFATITRERKSGALRDWTAQLDFIVANRENFGTNYQNVLDKHNAAKPKN